MTREATRMAPNETPRGFRLDIYRKHGTNSSNGGITANPTIHAVTVTHFIDATSTDLHRIVTVPPELQVWAAADDRPEAALVLRRILGLVLCVVPLGQESITAATSGGCLVDATDSRWSRFVEGILGHPHYGALNLHDRWEA